MSSNEDEEEEITTEKQTNWRNAFWARVHEEERAGFSSEFRGVSQGPHGGQQRVRPSDIIGDYDTCWCGLPADHDWQGKASGRKHPKEARVSTASAETEVPHITNSELGGFSESYREIILKAVNEYRVRYRKSNRGILLYPHDGTAPLSLPQRENTRTLKAARIWFIKHVADPETEARMDKLRETKSMEEAAKTLAAELNNPVEHPAPKEKPVSKDPPVQTKPVVEEEPLLPMPEGTQAVYDRLSAKDELLPLTEGWHYWIPRTIRYENLLFQTDGTTIGCLVKDCGFTTTSGKGAVGHLVKHDREGRGAVLWGPESQQKKRVTLSQNRMTTQIEAAVEILNHALGVEPVKVDTEAAVAKAVGQRDKVHLAVIAKATAERDDWKSKYEDLKAKLDLLKDL